MDSSQKRLPSIDCAKGFLILMVVVSNFIHKNGSFSPYVNYILYSFHMPMFMAISGFLISDRTLSLDTKRFILKYTKRLVIPFVIAWPIYYFVWYRHYITWESFFHALTLPMFHLWYVYTLLIFTFFLYTMKRLHASDEAIFIVGWSIALAFILLLAINSIREYIVTYQPYYLGFFISGYYMRKKGVYIPKRFLAPTSVFYALLFAYRIHVGSRQNFAKITGDFMLLNIVGVPLLLSYINAHPKIHVKYIGWIGEHSYPIYLWHPMVATLISYLPYGSITRWIIGVIAEIGMILFFYILPVAERKIRCILKCRIIYPICTERFVFGEWKSELNKDTGFDIEA